ncbi:MAG: hypothetical protein Q9165_002923 [Trypethelium subeluteriae]
MASEACAIVSQIRFEEQQTVWTSDFEDELARTDVDYYPGMMFTHAKERMEKTKLWKIVERMPKGALLHCHYEATVDTDWFIEQAMETPGLHIESAAPLVPENLSSTVFAFSYANSVKESAISIWSDSYIPDTKYVDVRKAMMVPLRREKSETIDSDHEGMLAVMGEEIENFKQSEEGKGFWGAKLIWTTMRIFDKRKMIANMKECIRMKQIFPELIAGFDLVGHEDAGRPLVDILPELFWFKKRCREEDVDIPFFFHAGETLGDGDETDENLFDAILLGTRRIGHGFSLYKHPLLIDMIKEKRILIESCPVSNEVLRYTGSILQHPLPALLSRGVPVALSNDDPAVLDFGRNGMTHDFWQALQGWENLGLEGLGSLAENSIRYAAFEDCSAKEWTEDIKAGAYGKGIRAQRMKEWAQEWEKFCQWVVLEFGADMDLEQVD